MISIAGQGVQITLTALDIALAKAANIPLHRYARTLHDIALRDAAVAAKREEIELPSPMPDPEFSLDELDQAEAVIKSLGPR